jgi:hypothetical protein
MAKKKPSTENKLVARHAASAFGGDPQVAEYFHDTDPLTVNILWCDDRPVGDLISYSTIGLSDCAMKDEDGADFPLRVELAGLCQKGESNFANVLASAAFCIMRTLRLIAPGSVMPNYVKEYFTSTTVPHLYFTAPYIWDNELATLDLSSKRVAWLLVMPISDRERRFIEENGDDKFESLLEKQQIVITDLYRSSAV